MRNRTRPRFIDVDCTLHKGDFKKSFEHCHSKDTTSVSSHRNNKTDHEIKHSFFDKKSTSPDEKFRHA